MKFKGCFSQAEEKLWVDRKVYQEVKMVDWVGIKEWRVEWENLGVGEEREKWGERLILEGWGCGVGQ